MELSVKIIKFLGKQQIKTLKLSNVTCCCDKHPKFEFLNERCENFIGYFRTYGQEGGRKGMSRVGDNFLIKFQ